MTIGIKKLIFIQRNNSFTVEYGGITLPTPTKIEFELNNKNVNSVTNPEFFTSTLEVDGRITFALGAAGFVAADSSFATVVIYDVVNTEGVVYTSPEGPTKMLVNVL